jgi:polar amino acid transport system permease protein
MRRVILPQALRRMLPAFTNRGIEIFKMTTLASALAYVELLQQEKLLASLNFNPIETYTVIAVVFFLFLSAGAGDVCARAKARALGRVPFSAGA